MRRSASMPTGPYGEFLFEYLVRVKIFDNKQIVYLAPEQLSFWQWSKFLRICANDLLHFFQQLTQANNNKNDLQASH